MIRWVKPLTVGVILVLVSVQAQAVNEYVQITKENVNIRDGATTSSTVIGKAGQGDIFELQGEKGSWFEIHLFSGDSRYVHKSLARKVAFKPAPPENEDLRRQLYTAWNEAAKKAQLEADERYPLSSDPKRNIAWGNLLHDRYKLEVMQSFQIPTPVYRRIIIEGNQKNW